jgi:hypothetical protein
VAIDRQHGRRPAGEHPGGGGIFTVAVNRLTERYLVDTALPASIEAIRNDIERMLGQPWWQRRTSPATPCCATGWPPVKTPPRRRASSNT